MTEPSDPSAPMPGPDAASLTPVEPGPPAVDEPMPPAVEAPMPPAVEPDAAVAWALVPPANTGSATGWVAPPKEGGGGGWAKGCAIAAVVGVGIVGLILVLSVVGLIFLGGQVQSILKGTMEFGTGGTDCAVTGRATTFPASTTIHLVAYFEREVPVGETVTQALTSPDGTTDTADQTFTSSASCVFQDIDPGLAAGHYRMEFRSAGGVLSKGEFDITP